MEQNERRAGTIPPNTFDLPAEYYKLDKIDLLGNRRQLLLVNGLALVLVVVMIAAALMARGLNFRGGIGMILLKIAALAAAMAVYILLHELVHGIFIKKYSGKPASYGLGMGYAYAGSKAYFNKKSYIIIALAPVVIWGVVLLVLNLLLPSFWFWVVYGVQVLNLSGAAGDYFVTYKMLKMPPDILVRDSGTLMLIYAPRH